MAERFQFNRARPPRSPQVRHGGSAANAVTASPSQDTARYLLDPDDDFARPYLAVAGTKTAFVWPVGVEGFDIEDQAVLGRHKYLGDIQLDVDVVHRGEMMITMTGIFPGWTSVDNMSALRQVFRMESPKRGKILHLPGILPHLQYVVCESLRHGHPDDERKQDISYSLTMVVIGTGPVVPRNLLPGVPGTGPTKGRSQKKFIVNATVNTLRKIAQNLYGDTARWTSLYAIRANAAYFDKHGIPSHTAPDKRLPKGTAIYYD